MKCPQCKQEGCKYLIPRQDDNKKAIKRTNFKAKHKCGWEGLI